MVEEYRVKNKTQARINIRYYSGEYDGCLFIYHAGFETWYNRTSLGFLEPSLSRIADMIKDKTYDERLEKFEHDFKLFHAKLRK